MILTYITAPAHPTRLLLSCIRPCCYINQIQKNRILDTMASMNKFLLGSTLVLFFYTTNISFTKGATIGIGPFIKPDLHGETEFDNVKDIQKRSLFELGGQNVNAKTCTKGGTWCSAYSRIKCCTGYYCKRTCTSGGCSDHGTCILQH